MFSSRLFWALIILVMFFSSEAFAGSYYVAVEDVAPNISLQIFINKWTNKASDNEPEITVSGESSLIVKSSSSQILMLISLEGSHDSGVNLIGLDYVFTIDAKKFMSVEQIDFEKPGQVTLIYKIDDQAFSEELWFHDGIDLMFDDDSTYSVYVTPFSSVDASNNDELYKRSASFIEKIRNAKVLKIKFTLASGLTAEDTFDLSSFNKGIEKLNIAYAFVSEQKQLNEEN